MKNNVQVRQAPVAERSGGRRRGRPSTAEASRISEGILASATEIFLTRTYEEASIEAVATRAGVKKDTLYKRYDDKRTLLRAVLTRQIAGWRADGSLTISGEGFEARLKGYAVAMLSYATSREGRIWIRHVESAWPGIDEFENRHAALGYDNAVRNISREIRQQTARDERPAHDPDLVATAFMAMLTGWTNAIGLGRDVTKAELESVASSAVDLIFYGRSVW